MLETYAVRSFHHGTPSFLEMRPTATIQGEPRRAKTIIMDTPNLDALSNGLVKWRVRAAAVSEKSARKASVDER